MNIYVNSEYREIPENVKTVGNLLDYLDIKRTGTGVGVNNRLIVARNWDSVSLQPDDRVTIISAAYGG